MRGLRPYRGVWPRVDEGVCGFGIVVPARIIIIPVAALRHIHRRVEGGQIYRCPIDQHGGIGFVFKPLGRFHGAGFRLVEILLESPVVSGNLDFYGGGGGCGYAEYA